jgi:hypothetical protein
VPAPTSPASASLTRALSSSSLSTSAPPVIAAGFVTAETPSISSAGRVSVPAGTFPALPAATAVASRSMLPVPSMMPPAVTWKATGSSSSVAVTVVTCWPAAISLPGVPVKRRTPPANAWSRRARPSDSAQSSSHSPKLLDGMTARATTSTKS